MNIELVFAAIKEVREARKELLIKCIENGAERSQKFLDAIATKVTIDEFENVVGEIYSSLYPN